MFKVSVTMSDVPGNTGLMTLEDTARNLTSMVELAKAANIKVASAFTKAAGEK